MGPHITIKVEYASADKHGMRSLGLDRRLIGVLVGCGLLAACGPFSSPATNPAPATNTGPAPTTTTTSPTATSPTTTPPTTTPATTPPTTAAPTTTTTTAAAPPSSPYGPRLAGEPQIGATVHATWSNVTPSSLNAVYSQLAATGLKWVSIDMGWASFETNGPGQLTSYVQIADDAVNQARAHGFQVLAVLWSTPGWANGGQGTNVPPTNPRDYANFAQWAASHFAGRVAAWEIWNEPNTSAFWAGTNPAAYAALVKVSYQAFKAGDPSTLVVVGNTSYNDTAYLSALYANGIHGYFDVLATHPYQGIANLPPETADDGTQWTLSHIPAVHSLMAANGDAAKPIWFTEFGWSSHANAAGSPNWMLGVTAAQQGDYFVRTLRWIAANAPYVTNAFWYEGTDQSGTDIQNGNYGVLTTGFTPKPSGTTVQAYLNQ
jgi:polysaccharide biosynthesis protein PslG